MATILRQRKQVKVELYHLCFAHVDNPGSGYSFPCDKDGNVKMDKLTIDGERNLRLCQTGEMQPPVQPTGVEDLSYYYWEPAIIKCACGTHLALEDLMTNSCNRCDRLYNGSGQALAPMHQWEEEW